MNSFKVVLIIIAISITTFSYGQMNIAQGKTTVNNWQNYNPNTPNPEVANTGLGGIYVDIDTRKCNFKETPHYIVSVESGKKGGHWLLNGNFSHIFMR